MKDEDRAIVNDNIKEIKNILEKLRLYRGWNGPEEVEKEFDHIERLVDSMTLFLVGEENEQETSQTDFVLPPRD